MPLPDLIEIVPLDKPVHAEITVPGSKSITNRALVLAALADGKVTLEGALWSEDTQVMVECLQRLGFDVRVEADPNESCNRMITVRGGGGKVPNAGTEDRPLELFVGNAGTAARFLSALVCLGRGVYRLSGVPRMHERPQAALFKALRELGYRIDAEHGNEKLPAVVHGIGVRASLEGRVPQVPYPNSQGLAELVPPSTARCRVSIEESSQFASALLLCAERGGWQIEVTGENTEESPYVAMTSEMIKVFPKAGGRFSIEPDASSGSYFWAAGWAAPGGSWNPPPSAEKPVREVLKAIKGGEGGVDRWFAQHVIRFSQVTVIGWPSSGWQVDAKFPSAELSLDGKRIGQAARPTFSRRNDLGDSIMTLVSIAPIATSPIVFTELGRLRVQECERVVALRTELTKCGAKVIETGDTLEVFPSQLHGAEIETYNDHRMAMCFAVLGLKVPGIKLRNPSCVKKTFPNFFQKLAAAPPHGLGVTILDGHTGRKLNHDELFPE